MCRPSSAARALVPLFAFVLVVLVGSAAAGPPPLTPADWANPYRARALAIYDRGIVYRPGVAPSQDFFRQVRRSIGADPFVRSSPRARDFMQSAAQANRALGISVFFATDNREFRGMNGALALPNGGPGVSITLNVNGVVSPMEGGVLVNPTGVWRSMHNVIPGLAGESETKRMDTFRRYLRGTFLHELVHAGNLFETMNGAGVGPKEEEFWATYLGWRSRGFDKYFALQEATDRVETDPSYAHLRAGPGSGWHSPIAPPDRETGPTGPGSTTVVDLGRHSDLPSLSPGRARLQGAMDGGGSNLLTGMLLPDGASDVADAVIENRHWIPGLWLSARMYGRQAAIWGARAVGSVAGATAAAGVAAGTAVGGAAYGGYRMYQLTPGVGPAPEGGYADTYWGAFRQMYWGD